MKISPVRSKVLPSLTVSTKLHKPRPRTGSAQSFLFNIVAAASLGITGVAQAAGDAALGKALYQTRCTACHALDFNGIGPAHRGVFGRQAGKVANYNYSAGLKAAGLLWSEANLDLWLTDPEKTAPGQKMGLNVPEAKERSDLIAYLKQIPAKKE